MKQRKKLRLPTKQAVICAKEILAENYPEPKKPEIQIPTDWHKGMLLNVRNTGTDYTVTLFPEEYDPRHPERALHFRNPSECQDFVSRWYQRENSRAF